MSVQIIDPMVCNARMQVPSAPQPNGLRRTTPPRTLLPPFPPPAPPHAPGGMSTTSTSSGPQAVPNSILSNALLVMGPRHTTGSSPCGWEAVGVRCCRVSGQAGMVVTTVATARFGFQAWGRAHRPRPLSHPRAGCLAVSQSVTCW